MDKTKVLYALALIQLRAALIALDASGYTLEYGDTAYGWIKDAIEHINDNVGDVLL